MDVSEYVRRVMEAYGAAPGTCGAIRQPDPQRSPQKRPMTVTSNPANEGLGQD